MLKIHTKKVGSIAILYLQGRITRSEIESLRTGVRSLSAISTLVLDLASVSTIDAGGLSLLLELREQSQAKGIEFRLMNVTKLVNRVLEITHLDSVFETAGEIGNPASACLGRAMPSMQMACCA